MSQFADAAACKWRSCDSRREQHRCCRPRRILHILQILLFTIFYQTTASSNQSECPNDSCTATPDYLIIGAGGSGIQTALLLQSHGHTYRILEKTSTAASFWTRFPVFDELISVNKVVRNSTQRFRYDWHSFLESPINMAEVSSKYYPMGSEWHEYMNRVVEAAGISVEYEMEVVKIHDNKPCVHLKDGSALCAKYRIFIGTGLEEKDERYLRAMGGVRYSDMELELARNKRVCILGNGNAGFEIAQNVFSVADRVVVIGKRPTRISAVTKYTGDVRVKFLTMIENFHSKLLDTVVHEDLANHWMGLINVPQLNFTQRKELAKIYTATSYIGQYECELLVLATGFRSVVPGQRLKTRFPSYGDLYSPSENPDIHYIGWLMHRHDFQRGAGGFLSGYRYLIRNLIHHVRELDYGVKYPHLVLSKQEVLEHAVHRFQVADDLIILQDGVAIRDAIVPSKENGKYLYYEGITYKFFKGIDERENIIYLYFAWGDGRSAASVFDNVYMYNDTSALRNIYLHPMVEVNGLVREAEEDLEMAWKTAQFIPPIKRIVRDALREDYSKFYPKPSYPYQSYQPDTPKDHIPHEAGKNYPKVEPGNLMNVAATAIAAGGTKNSLRALRAEAKKVFSDLYFPQKKLRAEDDDLVLEDEKCADAGSSCAGLSCCGNSTSCVYVSDFDASFCLNV